MFEISMSRADKDTYDYLYPAAEDPEDRPRPIPSPLPEGIPSSTNNDTLGISDGHENPLDVYERIKREQMDAQGGFFTQKDEDELIKIQTDQIMNALPEHIRQQNPRLQERVKYVDADVVFRVEKRIPQPHVEYVEREVERVEYRDEVIEIPGRVIHPDGTITSGADYAETYVPGADGKGGAGDRFGLGKDMMNETQAIKDAAAEADARRPVIVYERIVPVPKIQEDVVFEPVKTIRYIDKEKKRIVYVPKYVRGPDRHLRPGEGGSGAGGSGGDDGTAGGYWGADGKWHNADGSIGKFPGQIDLAHFHQNPNINVIGGLQVLDNRYIEQRVGERFTKRAPMTIFHGYSEVRGEF